METLEYGYRIRGLDEDGYMKAEESRSNSLNQETIWGVESEGYEQGWSSRIDRNTPALLSDSCVWYFDEQTEASIYEKASVVIAERAEPIITVIPMSIS